MLLHLFCVALTVIPQPVAVRESCGMTTNLSVHYVSDSSVAREGYRLTIAASGTEIASADDAGRFYADQTLAQLTKEGTRPCLFIEDAPAYGWRGVLLDESRHFFGKRVVKRTLDLMARYKLNRFHWHLTDDQGWRIDVKGYPELIRYGAVRSASPLRGAHPKKGASQGLDGTRYGPYFYTEADLREIVDYAAARHIEIVPEIDMPGHMFAALASYPEFACCPENLSERNPRIVWGVEEEVLCLGNDLALKFVDDVIDYVCRVFPGETIHLGGDECPKVRWRRCSKCQARAKAENLQDTAALQSWFIGRMSRRLSAHGKRMIGWDECLSEGAPSDIGIMHWRSWFPDGDTNGVSPGAAAALGHDLVMAPVQFCYLTGSQGVEDDPFHPCGSCLSLATCYLFNPIARVPLAFQNRVKGGQACLWTEHILNEYDLFWQLWPRGMALAEALWTGSHRSGYADFKRRAMVHFHQLRSEGVNVAEIPEEPLVFRVRRTRETGRVSVMGGQRYRLTFSSDRKVSVRVRFFGLGGVAVEPSEVWTTSAKKRHEYVFVVPCSANALQVGVESPQESEIYDLQLDERPLSGFEK